MKACIHTHTSMSQLAHLCVYMEVCVYKLCAGTKADDVPNKLHIIVIAFFIFVCMSVSMLVFVTNYIEK